MFIPIFHRITMSTTRSVSRAASSSPQPARGKARLHVSDLLLPISVCLWAVGLRRTNVTVLGSFGLLPHLSVIFYAGVALLVVSAAAELAHKRPSTWRMAAHAVALVVMLYGTAPLLYPEPRYTWVYKHIGVVQYISANGHLNDRIDIYQNYPGFFALAAWFTKLAGLGSPLGYAKWAQLFYELAALPLLYLIYKALPLTNRQRWVAILLYFAANWIGQDYFSPQATGTLLSLGIMAIAMRWLYVAKPERVPAWRWLRPRRARLAGAADEPAPRPPARRSIPVIIAILLMYYVLAFTHELSPYILAVQLGALAVVGALRPRWLPFALAAIAVGYLLPHYSFVSSNYRLTGPIGHFFKNITPPSAHKAAAPSERWIERCAEALSLGIWALAAVGAWLRRRAGQEALSLLLLAFSPVLVLVLQGYGNEGILRVFLFSLPWSAALAASALLPRLKGEGSTEVSQDQGPVPPPSGAVRRRRQRRLTAARRRLGALRVVVGLGAVLILFFPSFFGNDELNVMPQPEVATITSFLAHAAPGTIYPALGGAPLRDNARYNQFHIKGIFGRHGALADTPVGPEMANALANVARTRHRPDAPAYVVVAPSMFVFAKTYQKTPATSLRILMASLSHSPSWRLISYKEGTVIYELVPARASTGSLPRGSLPAGAVG
jgi:hypothetical protein